MRSNSCFIIIISGNLNQLFSHSFVRSSIIDDQTVGHWCNPAFNTCTSRSNGSIAGWQVEFIHSALSYCYFKQWERKKEIKKNAPIILVKSLNQSSETLEICVPTLGQLLLWLLEIEVAIEPHLRALRQLKHLFAVRMFMQKRTIIEELELNHCTQLIIIIGVRVASKWSGRRAESGEK